MRAPREYRRRYRMRGREWMEKLYDELMGERSHWFGVPALKNPLDIWIYQELLSEVRPDAVLELGSAFGGGTLFFCHMLDLLEVDGPVVTVDISHDRFEASHPRISAVTGDTRDLEVIAKVRELCEGRRVLAVHDASHEAPVVLEDLRAYSGLVCPGSYFVVEDGVTDYLAGQPGPVFAVEQFLRETDAFEIDESRERLLLTYNPRGFLRRKL